MRKAWLLVSLICVIASLCSSATIHIPADQPTIQAGIDVADHGDIVLVASGTYVENIDFLGKAIVVRSSAGPESTIIDGGSPMIPDFGSAVSFRNSEGVGSILDGFTVTNGAGTLFDFDLAGKIHCGGGILCDHSSPSIINNVIRDNAADCGSGICCLTASPEISNNDIRNNTADYGGGIYCSDSYATIANNTLALNIAASNGGGLYSTNSTLDVKENLFDDNTTDFGGGADFVDSPSIFRNNLVTNNFAHRWGAGIHCSGDCTPTIEDNVFLDNTAREFGGAIHCRSLAEPGTE